MKKTIEEKEAIIAAYLMGETTYRKLAEQHEVDYRIIHSWVTKFQGKSLKKAKPPQVPSLTEEAPASKEVKQLQQELRKANLHNQLLNAIIDIAEEQLKIDIRKKSGTKR